MKRYYMYSNNFASYTKFLLHIIYTLYTVKILNLLYIVKIEYTYNLNSQTKIVFEHQNQYLFL